MNDEELESLKFLELKYRRADEIIPPFSRIDLDLESRSRLFALRKFIKIEKSTGECIGTHWSAMNEKECESLKLLELK